MPQKREIGKKIKEYFSEMGMSQTEVAKALDIQQAAVSNQLNGRPFGKNAAAKWSNAFGFRVNWLLTGEGPMFETQNTPHLDGLLEDHPELNHADDIPVIPARLFRAPELDIYEYVIKSSSVDRLPPDPHPPGGGLSSSAHSCYNNTFPYSSYPIPHTAGTACAPPNPFQPKGVNIP